uniref:Inosine/uridine-preferring nucleoside hydrolase domain-containing protein n=1 Tax=Solanum lycopersicum TaxID=4081 RepID=A0A3Q7JCW6_SOLLC
MESLPSTSASFWMSISIITILHTDPTALLAAVNPSLLTYSEGVVRVQTVGITKGLTIFYNKQKRFVEVTEWSEKPIVKVAATVDAPKVIELVMTRLVNS